MHGIQPGWPARSSVSCRFADANSSERMASPHTGTTVIAVSYNGGVVLGSDSRVSMGQYISNRASSKVTPLAENIWLLRSGSAADAQGISDYGDAFKRLNVAIQCFGSRRSRRIVSA